LNINVAIRKKSKPGKWKKNPKRVSGVPKSIIKNFPPKKIVGNCFANLFSGRIKISFFYTKNNMCEK
jgi:hypothetical protein